MRLFPAFLSVLALAASAAAADPSPGFYICRTKAGAVAPGSFALEADGSYSTGGAESSRGMARFSMGEIVFSGGRHDGRSMLVINETRVKMSKRIFCTLQPLDEDAAPEPMTPSPEPTPKPGPKLIVIKP